MMQVFLVRHAQSNFQEMEDHLRPLSEFGEYQAQLTAQYIKRHIGTQKALIISSYATRTMSTSALIKEQLSNCHMIHSETFYSARSGDWCDALFDNRDAAEHIILVGHNPTMGRLSSVLNEQHAKRFSPACVAQYALEIEQDGLKLPAQFLDFYTPHAE